MGAKFRVMRGAAVMAAVACLAILADETPKFSVNVNVVNILATVRDRDGRIVSDLDTDDFLLEENGRPREIRYFARQTDTPLTIGLLFDTSLSQRNVLEDQRRGSYLFFDQVLRPEGDLAFVIRFDVDVELLEDLTNDRELLRAALNRLEVPGNFLPPMPGGRFSYQGIPGSGRLPDIFGIPGTGGRGGGRGRGGGGQQPPWPGGGSGGRRVIGTAMYDAIFLAADEVLREQAGRKTIILISDGVDHGSIMSQYDAIEAAQRAEAIVSSIRYADEGGYGGFGRRRGGRGGRFDGAAVLRSISTETGGRMFDVNEGLSLDGVFEQIQEELRNQYSIGFSPADGSEGSFHRIKLTTKNKKLKVQTQALLRRPVGWFPAQDGHCAAEDRSA